VVAAASLAAGALLLTGDRFVSARLPAILGGASAATYLTVGALAAVRYARGRDPHALFVATGTIVIGIQATLGLASAVDAAGVHAIRVGGIAPALAFAEHSILNGIPVTLWLAGWAVAAVHFSLATPWRDRRGRPPLRPTTVIWPTIGGLVAIDLAIVAGLRDLSVGLGGDTDPGSVAIGFGVVGTILLVLAGIRELRFRSSAAPHPQLGVAWLIAALVPVAQIQGVTFGLDLVRWVDGASLIAGSIALSGLLAAERSDATRMRRATDRAEEVLGGRAEIASMMAHEVKGPVSTIKGLAATTSGSYAKLSDEERQEFVGLIEQEASRLLDVVDQTSLALKLDAGTLTFERRSQDLATVVREGVAEAGVTDHPVTTTLAEGVTATVDRRWLSHAVRQGVANAARFSPVGGPITISLRTGEGRAVIEIADEGPGVPVERRAEVFERFSRWRPPGYEDRQGSGLGLFICRGLLAEHAGDASLDAGPEGGTMLRLTIPVDAPPTEG